VSETWAEHADERFKETLHLLARACYEGDRDAIALIGSTFRWAGRQKSRRIKRRPPAARHWLSEQRKARAELLARGAALQTTVAALAEQVAGWLGALRDAPGRRPRP